MIVLPFGIIYQLGMLMVVLYTEKAKIEAQIKAAEAASRVRAEAEVKLQRDKAREAARLALEKVHF